jgi:hypothetical protein
VRPFFLPKHLRPRETAVLAPEVGLESIGQEPRARASVDGGAETRRATPSPSVEG